MKKTKEVIILALAVILVSSSGFAQTASRVTIGGSYWNATYSMVDKDGNELGDYGTGNMFGPYLRFSHGKFNFGTSMFFGSFPVEGLDYEGFEAANVDLTMGRSDLNFTLGFQVIPYINIFAGVKYLNYSFDGDVTVETSYWDYDYLGRWVEYTETVNMTMEFSESGPMFGLGLAGVIPFGQSPLYGFASIAGMAGTLTNEYKYSIAGSMDFVDGMDFSEEVDVDASLAAITVGLGYHAPSGLGVSIGYRADLFDENVSDSEEEPDIRVQGLYATLSYTF